MTEGQVVNTCEEVGMKAVCSGPSNCKYSSSRCMVTTLSTNCNNPMYPLPKLLYSGSKPRKYPQFEGVFSYMPNWAVAGWAMTGVTLGILLLILVGGIKGCMILHYYKLNL